MFDFFVSGAACVVLGIMTTMHPCPLTANIAAISLLSGSSRNKKRQISVLVLFSLGYVFGLMGIAVLITFSLISIPKLSVFLQGILSAYLGPMIIFVGMVISEMIKLSRFHKGLLPNKEFWKSKPPIYIFLMGAMLALTFCPATAFIYFGILIPLSVDNNQIMVFPLLFAAGALLPIAAISILINRGFIVILKEKWTKKIPLITGWILILSGIYITLEQLYF